jgi:hypothetical protein
VIVSQGVNPEPEIVSGPPAWAFCGEALMLASAGDGDGHGVGSGVLAGADVAVGAGVFAGGGVEVDCGALVEIGDAVGGAFVGIEVAVGDWPPGLVVGGAPTVPVGWPGGVVVLVWTGVEGSAAGRTGVPAPFAELGDAVADVDPPGPPAPAAPLEDGPCVLVPVEPPGDVDDCVLPLDCAPRGVALAPAVTVVVGRPAPFVAVAALEVPVEMLAAIEVRSLAFEAPVVVSSLPPPPQEAATAPTVSSAMAIAATPAIINRFRSGISLSMDGIRGIRITRAPRRTEVWIRGHPRLPSRRLLAGWRWPAPAPPPDIWVRGARRGPHL